MESKSPRSDKRDPCGSNGEGFSVGLQGETNRKLLSAKNTAFKTPSCLAVPCACGYVHFFVYLDVAAYVDERVSFLGQVPGQSPQSVAGFLAAPIISGLALSWRGLRYISVRPSASPSLTPSHPSALVSEETALVSEDTAVVSEGAVLVSEDGAVVSEDVFAENPPTRVSHSSICEYVGVRSSDQQWLLTSGVAISQLVLVYSSTYSCICESAYFGYSLTNAQHETIAFWVVSVIWHSLAATWVSGLLHFLCNHELRTEP